ncbi:hypothetical protein KR018_011486, partial [Drosophila ironensis]
MSLFPAYSSGAQKPGKDEEAPKKGNSRDDAWKTNSSFVPNAPVSGTFQVSHYDHKAGASDSSSSSGEGEAPPTAAPGANDHLQPMEFDGQEDFYVDKKGNSMYKSEQVRTLSRPAKPQYKVHVKRLRDPNQTATGGRWSSKGRNRRLQRSAKRSDVDQWARDAAELLSDELLEVRMLAHTEPENLGHWVRLHRLLGHNVDRANKLELSEHQLEILDQALVHHPSNEQLLQLYTETANEAYPANQVAVLIRKKLDQSPFQYSLWTTLILATQGTMATCNLPSVLDLYKNSMRRMYVGKSDGRPDARSDGRLSELDSQDVDILMLKLFNNLSLFLRQSGNYNIMFALIQLSLEVNFPGLTIEGLEACAADEKPLIEFEEAVLASGLPLPEIWNRIERMRQGYLFLPYPLLNDSKDNDVECGLDAMRIVYRADVCDYAYALNLPQNRFHLALLIVQLMKLPILRTDCLAERLSAQLTVLGESDAVEQVLAGLADRSCYAVRELHKKEFFTGLLDLAKELCVEPSYMCHVIGSELYFESMSKLLLNLEQAFKRDEPKRVVFIVLWFRLRRLVLIMLKLKGRPTAEFCKTEYAAMRRLIGAPENRHVMRLYTELAMWHFEQLDDEDDPAKPFKVLKKVLETLGLDGRFLNHPDQMHAYMVFAEMLVSRNRREQALHLLCCICLGIQATAITQEDAIRSVDAHEDKFMFNKELHHTIEQPAKMALEEYYLPNMYVILVRAKCMVLCLQNNAAEADKLLHELLNGRFTRDWAKANERIRFVREQLLEVQIITLQMPMNLPLPDDSESMNEVTSPVGMTGRTKLLIEALKNGLDEYPRNMMMLQSWTSMSTMEWFRLRTRLVSTKGGIMPLLHLVVAARTRFGEAIQPSTFRPDVVQTHLETAVRNRLVNIFETYQPSNPNRTDTEAEQWLALRKNSLYWRLYLRSIADKRTSMERVKECLLTGLDEVPWSKALYMDGTIFVPEEVTHLQDLMTEKSLRMYAMPEELDILRQS